MSVCVRVDSSYRIGSGHLHRCLTLAESLRGLGERVVFVCRDLPGAATQAVSDAGFESHVLPARDLPSEKHATAHATWLCGTRSQDADDTLEALDREGIRPGWVIVDSYALDAEWESHVRSSLGCRIAVIDDLADRAHDCDVLMDTGCADRLASAYERLNRRPCEPLLGPGHAFLRREFTRAKAGARARTSIRRVLVFFGGADPDEVTVSALEGIAPLCADAGVRVDVVWGGSYEGVERLKRRFGGLGHVDLIGPTREMANLMSFADVALGAGGTTTWERCYLGLPSILATLAANQEELVSCVTRAGAAVALPRGMQSNPAAWRAALERLLSDEAKVSSMSEGSFELMAQAGPARRHALVGRIIGEPEGVAELRLRSVEESDLPALLTWRNSAEVSRWMTERHIISEEEHQNWFNRLRQGGDRRAWVLDVDGVPSGFFQLRDIDASVKSAEWGFYLSPESLGKGLSAALCFLGAEAAFDEVGLETIRAEVVEGNVRSDMLHDEFGFAESSRGPEGDGRWRLLTFEEWDRKRPAIARKVYGGDRHE